MAKSAFTKEGHRLNMYLSKEQFIEIEDWVSSNDITLTEFCREAIRTFLMSKRKEIREEQLAETCKILNKSNNQCLNQWMKKVKKTGQYEST